jgi:hypothetical protein
MMIRLPCCRWGFTPLDEARRSRAEQVVAYLEEHSNAAVAQVCGLTQAALLHWRRYMV